MDVGHFFAGISIVNIHKRGIPHKGRGNNVSKICVGVPFLIS